LIESHFKILFGRVPSLLRTIPPTFGVALSATSSLGSHRAEFIPSAAEGGFPLSLTHASTKFITTSKGYHFKWIYFLFNPIDSAMGAFPIVAQLDCGSLCTLWLKAIQNHSEH
jgi:hypothetical protein